MEVNEIDMEDSIKESGKLLSLNNNSSQDVPIKDETSNDRLYSMGIIGRLDCDSSVSPNDSPLKPLSPSLLHSSPERSNSCDRNFFSEIKRRKFDDDSIQGDDFFDSLSDEIVLKIFSTVPKSTLATLSLVCKRFRKICLDESLWQRYDLSFKTLSSFTLGYVLTRGVKVLRLNSSTVSSPIFDSTVSNKPTNYFFRVEYLDLSAVTVSKADLLQLMRRCRFLKKLSLEACNLSDDICSAISQNKQLDTINLSMCSDVTPSGLTSIVSACQMLEAINISWCSLTPEAVSSFCQNISTNLVSLNLAGCRNALSNNDVRILVDRCPELSELDVSDCSRITGDIIDYLMDGADNLIKLSLSRCYKITPANLMNLKKKGCLSILNIFGHNSGCMFPSAIMKTLKSELVGVSINNGILSPIARPTVGIRRTSVWGIRCRD